MTTESQPCIFKVGETYKTRGGGTARVICTDAKGSFPIVALHKRQGHESVTLLLLNGCWCDSAENDFDLLPPEAPKPVKVRRWCAVYRTHIVMTYLSEQAARAGAPQAIAIISYVFEIPPDIAAQCDWLKDAEIVDE